MSEPAQTRLGRLLVVDDNTDAADIIALLLRELGYEVAVAYDGPSALELARTFEPGIAVLDIGLPLMDGYELARQLRKEIADLRCIALSGNDRRQHVDASLAAGFDGHLGKPVDFDKLVAVLGDIRSR